MNDEVMYQPIYKDQKLFPDIDRLLTAHGMIRVGHWPLPPPDVFGDAMWVRQ